MDPCLNQLLHLGNYDTCSALVEDYATSERESEKTRGDL